MSAISVKIENPQELAEAITEVLDLVVFHTEPSLDLDFSIRQLLHRLKRFKEQLQIPEMVI